MSDRQPFAYTRHHRKPRSRGGGNEPENISHIPVHHHRAWHLIFRNHEPKTIVAIINQLYLDPEYELIVRRKK